MKATLTRAIFQQPLESTRWRTKEKSTKITASIGLLIGGILGMAGSFAPSASLRSLAWGLDGTALIVASALLAVYYFRKGYDATAAGFLIFSMPNQKLSRQKMDKRKMAAVLLMH